MLRCEPQRAVQSLIARVVRHEKHLDPPHVISQGDPDNIEKTYYTWGMQLDTVEWEDEEGLSF